MRKPVFGLSDQVGHKLAVQRRTEDHARGLKFRIREEECSENKGAAQLLHS